MRRLILLAALGVLATAAAHAQETPIVFRHDLTPDEIGFVVAELPRVAPETPWITHLSQGLVRLGVYDFDGDGIAERLVMAEAPGQCGPFGCTTVLMWYTRGTWRMVLTRRMDPSAVRAAPPVARFTSYGIRHGEFTTSFNLVDGAPVEFWTATGDERAWAVETVINDYIERDSLLNAHRAELDRANIKLADVDLGDSNFSERIIMVDHPAWCGSAGCASLVLTWWNDDWRVILRGAMAAEGETFVLPEIRNGWRRLRTPESIYTFNDRGAADAEDVETGRERGIDARTDTR